MRVVTYQLDDLDEDPVVGGGGHELEEQRGQRQVVLGVPPGQLTDDVHRRRLDAYMDGAREEETKVKHPEISKIIEEERKHCMANCIFCFPVYFYSYSALLVQYYFKPLKPKVAHIRYNSGNVTSGH